MAVSAPGTHLIPHEHHLHSETEQRLVALESGWSAVDGQLRILQDRIAELDAMQTLHGEWIATDTSDLRRLRDVLKSWTDEEPLA